VSFLLAGAFSSYAEGDKPCTDRLNQAFCCSALGLKYAKVSDVIQEGPESATVLIMAIALGSSNKKVMELLQKYHRDNGDQEISQTFDYICR